MHEEALVQVPNRSWPVGPRGLGVGWIDHPEREAEAGRADKSRAAPTAAEGGLAPVAAGPGLALLSGPAAAITLATAGAAASASAVTMTAVTSFVRLNMTSRAGVPTRFACNCRSFGYMRAGLPGAGETMG